MQGSAGGLPETSLHAPARAHVITTEGWDADDGRLRLSVVHKVGTLTTRFVQRGLVQKVGERQRAELWRPIPSLPLSDAWLRQVTFSRKPGRLTPDRA